MTKNQMLLTSLLVAVPAVALIIAIALAALSGAAGGLMMWGLLGVTFLLSIVASASPVAVFLLIPDAAEAEAPVDSENSTDADADEDAFEDGEEDTDAAADLGDFDDDDDFQIAENADEEFDDFDDDEDFV